MFTNMTWAQMHNFWRGDSELWLDCWRSPTELIENVKLLFGKINTPWIQKKIRLYNWSKPAGWGSLNSSRVVMGTVKQTMVFHMHFTWTIQWLVTLLKLICLQGDYIRHTGLGCLLLNFKSWNTNWGASFLVLNHEILSACTTVTLTASWIRRNF